MVLYGLYMVPRKRSKVSQSTYTFWMGCGILIGTTLIGAVSGGIAHVTLAQYLLIFFCGVFWATGTDAYCRAVRYIGLSRSTPIKNTSAFLGMLCGIIAFHEFSARSGASLVLVIVGSVAVTGSAVLLGRVEANGAEKGKASRRKLVLGVLCSMWAAIAYSAYTIPMKIAYQQGVSPSAFLFYMGQGCFVGMVLMALLGGFRPAPKLVTWYDRNLALISGAMWALGSLCANIAVKLIGIAITWPLTKNTVVAVVYGAFVLREIDVMRHRRNLSYGLALSVIGVILLALATGRG